MLSLLVFVHSCEYRSGPPSCQALCSKSDWSQWSVLRSKRGLQAFGVSFGPAVRENLLRVFVWAQPCVAYDDTEDEQGWWRASVMRTLSTQALLVVENDAQRRWRPFCTLKVYNANFYISELNAAAVRDAAVRDRGEWAQSWYFFLVRALRDYVSTMFVRSLNGNSKGITWVKVSLSSGWTVIQKQLPE